MAQGKGEKLNTLAQLNGCTSVDAQVAFAGLTQKSFEKIVPASDTKPQDMVKNLKSEMTQDPELNMLCDIAAL